MTHESATASLTPPVGERDHQQGPETAPVTVVEYGAIMSVLLVERPIPS